MYYKCCKICWKAVWMGANDLRCKRCRAEVDKELEADGIQENKLSKMDLLLDENWRLKREVNRLLKIIRENFGTNTR